MEKTGEWKEKQLGLSKSQGRSLIPPDNHHEVVDKYGLPPPPEQVKLAAIAISLNIRLRSADMPVTMQERALRHARSVLDASPSRRPNLTLLARSLKQEFDKLYGPAWQCVVGKSFGSFVTHTPGGFVYFSIDSGLGLGLSFLLFKTEVHLVRE